MSPYFSETWCNDEWMMKPSSFMGTLKSVQPIPSAFAKAWFDIFLLVLCRYVA